MRILVTGANGFVGSALARRFAEDGRTLTVATRGGDPVAGAPRATPVAVGAIGPETDWTRALYGVDVVVHAAARVHVAPGRAGREAPLFECVNRLGTATLFTATAEAGVRLFVFVSSITVLGSRTSPGRAFADDDAPGPESVYARSKADAERDLARLSGEANAPALVVLRPPLVAGRGAGGNLAALLRLARWPVPLPLAGIRNRRTLLSLPNLVACIGRVIDHPLPALAAGTYNLGDERSVSTSEIVGALQRGLGGVPGLFACPEGLLRMTGRLPGLGGIARRLLDDLCVDSSGFRERFGFGDLVGTADTLADMAAHAAGRRA